MGRSRHHEAEAQRQAAQQEGDGGIPDSRWSAWIPLPFGGGLGVSWLHAERQRVAKGSGMGSKANTFGTHRGAPGPRSPGGGPGSAFLAPGEKKIQVCPVAVVQAGALWKGRRGSCISLTSTPCTDGSPGRDGGSALSPHLHGLTLPDPPLHRVDLWRASARPGERLVPQLHD